MALQRNSSRADSPAREIFCPRPVRRLSPLRHQFAIHFDSDGVALHNDVVREPLVILGNFFTVILYLIRGSIEIISKQASGFISGSCYWKQLR
jgi:hypothetical protein